MRLNFYYFRTVNRLGCRYFMTLLFYSVSACFGISAVQAQSYILPAESNSFMTRNDGAQAYGSGTPDAYVGGDGIYLSHDTKQGASTYFYVQSASEADLALRTRGKGVLAVACGNRHFTVKVNAENEWKQVKVGHLKFAGAGYVRVDFQLSEQSPEGVVTIGQLQLDGLPEQPYYIRDGFSSHFGRRGPSVHLQYGLPKQKNAEWIYNEVTVPADGEVMSSYYCTLGFNGGYFGFQYNSPTERRILFSVWSPYSTNNPGEIPEEYRVKMLRKGETTHVGSFGNEGAGAQSFLVYPWKAGNTYSFLLHVKPFDENQTDYTAYFYAPEEGRWMLVASFRRPHTHNWVEGAYSFVENFSPEQGYLTRKAYFGNTWVYTTDASNWTPVNQAYFTNDDTGRNGIRVDYLGGVEKNKFFLKMGGFFGNGSNAERRLAVDASTLKAPQVDFGKLP